MSKKGKMNQEHVIGYNQFMPIPFQERIRLFNEVSTENRILANQDSC